MKNFSMLSKDDFSVIGKYSQLQNKKNEVQKKARMIRLGILFILALVITLIVIIILLMTKNKTLELKGINGSLIIPKDFHSDILTSESLGLLKEWIPHKEDNKYELKLLFKATRDGCTSDGFINAIEDKRPTIAIIESAERKIFGGYTEKSWLKTSKDSEAFLFSITNKEKYRIKEMSRAIYWTTNIVMRFGITDLIILNDCLNSPMSTSISSGAYQFTNSLNPSNEIQFKIKEIEVYQIKAIIN